MIKINAIVLSVIFAFMLVKPAIPFIEYLARKDFIIENFCINRNKKEMKCDGKCHLKEQVRKEASQSSDDKAPFRPKKERRELTDYLIGQKLTARTILFRTLLKAMYSMDYSFQFTQSIFHPPM
jgi:hypothetical protein